MMLRFGSVDGGNTTGLGRGLSVSQVGARAPPFRGQDSRGPRLNHPFNQESGSFSSVTTDNRPGGNHENPLYDMKDSRIVNRFNG